MKRIVACLVAVLAGGLHAYAWGCKGHQTVAFIALSHLRPEIAAQVDAILNASPIPATQRRGCNVEGLPPIVNVATWADDARDSTTGPYHYVDIPLGAVRTGFDFPALCKQDCVTWAITHYVEQVKTATDAEARAQALRFIVHFVGDVHQPLHGVDNADQGGNCVHVQLLGSNSNLHSVWDTGIITHIAPGNDAHAWAQQLDAAQPNAKPGSANPEDWAWESHDLALKNVYGPLPIAIALDDEVIKSCADRKTPLPVEDLDQAYIDQARPVVETRIDLAGLRLAALLNQTLGH